MCFCYLVVRVVWVLDRCFHHVWNEISQFLAIASCSSFFSRFKIPTEAPSFQSVCKEGRHFFYLGLSALFHLSHSSGLQSSSLIVIPAAPFILCADEEQKNQFLCRCWYKREMRGDLQYSRMKGQTKFAYYSFSVCLCPSAPYVLHMDVLIIHFLFKRHSC